MANSSRPAGINLDKQIDMADKNLLSDESFDKVLVKINMMSIKFNGSPYKIFDQDSGKAEEKVRRDIDIYMLLQFDPPRVSTVMLWKLKIAYDFYRIEGQNLSLFDTDVFRFLDVFQPIMEDQRFRAWWKAYRLSEDTTGLYMLVELAYDLKKIRY